MPAEALGRVSWPLVWQHLADAADEVTMRRALWMAARTPLDGRMALFVVAINRGDHDGTRAALEAGGLEGTEAEEAARYLAHAAAETEARILFNTGVSPAAAQAPRPLPPQGWAVPSPDELVGLIWTAAAPIAA